MYTYIHTYSHTDTHTHIQTHTLTPSWLSSLVKVFSSAVSLLIYLVKLDPCLVYIALFSNYSL